MFWLDMAAYVVRCVVMLDYAMLYYVFYKMLLNAILCN